MAYDAATSNRLDFTRLYAMVFGSAASFTAYGNGCAGPARLP